MSEAGKIAKVSVEGLTESALTRFIERLAPLGDLAGGIPSVQGA
jgi:hypothetical protein